MLIIYHIEHCVENLGPGKRFVLWTQGCRFKCVGCLVKDSWNMDQGLQMKLNDLIKEILLQNDIEGITISGGEPFEQIAGIYKLIKSIKLKRPMLSIMIFTGYKLKELINLNDDKVNYIISECDILIDGKFEKDKRFPDPWRGSTNQIIHFLSDKYGINDYKNAYKTLSKEFYIKEGSGFYFESGVPIQKS